MKRTKADELAGMFNIKRSRSIEAVLKAEIINAVLKVVEKEGLTHVQLAKRSGLARSTVTGILSGSLHKVTLDRVLKLLEGADLTAELRVKKAAA
ncbi:MAG: XRE family transcriptional regulator [Nitrospinae bacterium]|nr:XRE family transcriptional regulator [Nitrospinota bacterium]